MHRQILRLALPNIVTNITVPLLGMVDLAIVGRLGDTKYIGAIAIATMIFSMIYWLFGFLRMGTSGFTAQAYGAGDIKGAADILLRSLLVGLSAALCLIVLQQPIIDLAMSIVSGSEELKAIARRYFFVNIWGAPALLSMYSFKGWFIGMQNSNIPMLIAIVINVVNICLSYIFVFILRLDIEGVALGTVIAQYVGLGMAVWFFIARYHYVVKLINVAQSIVWDEMKRFFRVNFDIFLRTICLIAVFSFFPIAGSRFGDDTLAVNTLLMQFFTLFSYIMDGFAYAGEALTGRFIGAADRVSLRRSIRVNFMLGIGLTLIFTLIYSFGGEYLLRILTDKQRIIDLSAQYYLWVLLVPIAGFSAFLWDGIFIGATASRAMLYAIAVATALFFVIYISFVSILGNNALWLALIVFLATRGLGQTLLAKRSVGI